MRKILIRSGLSPLENVDTARILVRNLIGSNSGNLIYQYSIFRHLMTDNTVVVPTRYDHNYTNEEIEKINKEYSAFIIPLADAFRNTFISSLRTLTSLVKKLKIPCIVIGVGLRSTFEPKLSDGFIFDNDVKAFMKAVLRRSSAVGVRGEFTGQYLTNLGFKEDRDFVVIGCPSMYTFGYDLETKKSKIDKDSKICINFSSGKKKKTQKYLQTELMKYERSFFIPQNIRDLNLLYTGYKYTADEKDRGYPYTIDNEIYKSDKARFFVNAKSWMHFLKDSDLSFGTRLHGNVCAILSGTPAIIITTDSRTRELASYHKLPSIASRELDKNKSIIEYAEEMDLSIDKNLHKKNFEKYLGFLKLNDISTIFSNDIDSESTKGSRESAMDKKIKSLDLPPPVSAVTGCEREEILERLSACSKESALYIQELKGISPELTMSDCSKILRKAVTRKIKKGIE